MEIQVYSKNFCPYCDKAKALLEVNNINFEEINVQAAGETRTVPADSPMKTFPQIFVNRLLVGGFDQLLQIHQKFGLKDGLEKFVEQEGEI